MITSPGQQKKDEKYAHTAAVISLLASFLLLGLKALGYGLTGSSAVLSDALESIVNVVTAAVTLGVVRFAAQPADSEHPYGHGKAEYVSAAFEGGLIVFAAIAILLESARSLWVGVQLRQLEYGFLVMMLAAVLNLILGLYLKREGGRAHSQALLASSVHILSDVKTTVGVGIGLVLVHLTGWLWFDPLLASLVALHLAFEGSKIVRASFAGLVDATDQASLEKLSEAIRHRRRPGVIEIHLLRAIRSGHFHHIDAHMVVPEFWDIEKVHGVTEAFEKAVVADYPYDGEFAFHLDPCRRQYCQRCDLEDCPVRQKPFEKLNSFDVPSLIGRASQGE